MAHQEPSYSRHSFWYSVPQAIAKHVVFEIRDHQVDHVPLAEVLALLSNLRELLQHRQECRADTREMLQHVEHNIRSNPYGWDSIYKLPNRETLYEVASGVYPHRPETFFQHNNWAHDAHDQPLRFPAYSFSIRASLQMAIRVLSHPAAVIHPDDIHAWVVGSGFRGDSDEYRAGTRSGEGLAELVHDANAFYHWLTQATTVHRLNWPFHRDHAREPDEGFSEQSLAHGRAAYHRIGLRIAARHRIDPDAFTARAMRTAGF
ncbi:hypothetical protein JCM10207_004164 [Rhodosporidiobolus poonsookiae]